MLQCAVQCLLYGMDPPSTVGSFICVMLYLCNDLLGVLF